MTVSDKPTDFLSRWSQRKAAARDENAAAQATVEETPPLNRQKDCAPIEPSLEELSDEEALERLELPNPEQMSAGDDFSAFMKSGVPARLRNRALRKLWIANPALANLDELLDYGEDFTDAATVVENLTTAYQVGRGFLRDEPEVDRDARPSESELSATDEIVVDAENPPPSDASEIAEISSRNSGQTAASDDPITYETSISQVTTDAETNTARVSSATDETPRRPPLSRRRMTFGFES